MTQPSVGLRARSLERTRHYAGFMRLASIVVDGFTVPSVDIIVGDQQQDSLEARIQLVNFQRFD